MDVASRLRRTGAGVMVVGIALLLAPALAQAGQVGVTVSIQGSGWTEVVEGSLEDNGSTVCNWLSNKDERVTNSCDRVRNGEIAEAWVWLRPHPSTVPSGHWEFAGWSGCDETRSRDGFTECAVHSACCNGVERFPKAQFVDNFAPTVSAVTETFSTVAEKTVSYAFSTNEGQLQCRFDSEVDFTNCSSGVSRTYANSGVHSIDVRAVDASGQVSSTSSRTVTVVDTTLTGGPSGRVNSQSATFTFATDGGSGFECALDNAIFFSACGTGPAGAKSYILLAEGAHTFRVRGINGGWYDRIPAMQTWTIDVTPPVASLVANPQTPSESSLVTATIAAFSFGASEPVQGFRCSFDGAAFTPCTSPATYSGLAAAAHSFRVVAVDLAGNASAPVERQWTVVVADADSDGYNATADCNDRDRAINPGAQEILNNDADENCDGTKLFDRDNDGSLAGADCNDENAAVHPGAVDVPGNDLDEDCVGGPQPIALKPMTFTLAYIFHAGRTETKLKQFTVNGAPAGARVVVTCKGKACRKPKQFVVRKAKQPVKGYTGRTLKAGTVLIFTVSRDGFVTTVKKLKIRRGKPPHGSLLQCLPPGAAKPTACTG